MNVCTGPLAHFGNRSEANPVTLGEESIPEGSGHTAKRLDTSVRGTSKETESEPQRKVEPVDSVAARIKCTDVVVDTVIACAQCGVCLRLDELAKAVGSSVPIARAVSMYAKPEDLAALH